MDWFYLQPLSLLALTQVILALFIALYLLRIKNKTRATWMLFVALGAFALAWASDFINLSNPYFNFSVPLMMGSVVVFGLLHFSYAFLGNPFPRESNIIFRVTLVVVVAFVLYHLYRISTVQDIPDLAKLTQEGLNLAMLLWAVGVCLRKKMRLSDEGGSLPARLVRAQGREARALRAFALLMLAIIPLSLRSIWVEIGSAPEWASSYDELGFVLLLIAFVVIYINHASEPTTFLVKLVGLSLATLLLVLGLAALALYPNAEMRRASRAELPDLQSLRLEPDGAGGYRVAHLPLRFDADLGDDLDLAVEGDTLVSLGFAFPFYGTAWEAMYVDSNGLVTFGGAYLPQLFRFFYEDDLPKIAPYYRALVPLASGRSGVFYKREADRATVTWHRVRERYDERPRNENTIQLVLHRDGAIDFVYDRMEALPLWGIRGLRPGGAEPPMEVGWFAFPPTETLTQALLPEGRTIRFEPDPDGDYQFTRMPARFDADLGEDLQLTDREEAPVPLGFSFSFFETAWDSVIVHDNGVVSFGRSLYVREDAWFNPFHAIYAEVPLIAPVFEDLSPWQGGGVFYKRGADRATITWHQIPDQGQRYTRTVQLVLHRSGVIDFTYEHVGTSAFAADLWGLYPGQGRPPVDAVRYLMATNAYQGTPGAGLAENFSNMADLVFFRHRHARMLPFLYVILGSTLFILVIFPFLFRISLVHPLDALLRGVRRVDEGDLDTLVPVRVNDEIGLLAQNFNRMTASLKNAEDQLRAYAESLEDKVAQRTEDLQRALEHLTQTQDQLIHAEKMASLGQLTAGIAHEIKNPLNFVNNFAQLSVELADEVVQEVEAHPERSPAEVLDAVQDLLGDLKQNAEKIHEHGQRADGIVRSMLEHSRSGAGERRSVDLNGLLEEYVTLAYHGMRASDPEFDVTLEQDLDASVGQVEVAPQELGRVFINLLNNAFYAVREQAQVVAGVYAPTISVSTHRRNGSVEVRIGDNGPGVDEALQAKIFEPFFTTKPTGEGTGLGLSLSYDIVVQSHSGTLAVESTEGEGTTFVITLPD